LKGALQRNPPRQAARLLRVQRERHGAPTDDLAI